MILNWLRRFMAGRYGFDQLSFALLLLYMVLILVTRITRFWPLQFAALVLLAWCLFRMLSRNPQNRWKENQKFLSFWYPVKNWFSRRAKHASESKTYRFFKCPHCKQKMRAPRGKGKIRVTCSRCQHVFLKKT